MLDRSTPLSEGWRFVAIVVEGDPVNLRGRDPWRDKWVRVNRPSIVVAHPSYPAERHDMQVYGFAENPDAIFAAGEFSNGVWGFYLPEPGTPAGR